MKRLLVTGSREGWAYGDLYDALMSAAEALSDGVGPILVHGAARGVDSMAMDLWIRLGWDHESHPANWFAYGKRAGPLRNTEMVNLGADLCVAFIASNSRGTIDCADKAEAAGIKTVRHYKDIAAFKAHGGV